MQRFAHISDYPVVAREREVYDDLVRRQLLERSRPPDVVSFNDSACDGVAMNILQVG